MTLYERVHGKSPTPPGPQRTEPCRPTDFPPYEPLWVQRAREGKLRAKVLAG